MCRKGRRCLRSHGQQKSACAIARRHAARSRSSSQYPHHWSYHCYHYDATEETASTGGEAAQTKKGRCDCWSATRGRTRTDRHQGHWRISGKWASRTGRRTAASERSFVWSEIQRPTWARTRRWAFNFSVSEAGLALTKWMSSFFRGCFFSMPFVVRKRAS